jgi:hypothetical protein
VPHSKALPITEGKDTILYVMQRSGHRGNYWMAGFAGYEDGRWPDGPQWGPPGWLISKMRFRYYLGRLRGAKVRRLFCAAVPYELAAAREWSGVRKGTDAAELSDEKAFDYVRENYPGGWEAFAAAIPEDD